jgi:hypothetical protein
LFPRRSDLWGREGPVGEPFETIDALLGLGRRFICKGFIAEGGFWGGSMPGKAGRFDGKGGSWRDILRRSVSPLRRNRRVLVYYVISRRAPPRVSLSSTFVKGHYSVHAHPGNPAAESFDRRE